ncbi:MAG: hypothetical protein AAGG53_12355 [Cyanobacteria bacterium P01_H01_bin.152]
MLGLPFVHWLVILSSLISIAGASTYIRETLQGKTQPNRVTWSMWTLGPLLSATIAVATGADMWATVRVFLAGLLPLFVVLASFANPRSYWQLRKFDAICGGFSLLALVLWLMIEAPRTAILCAIAGEWCAFLPTLIKAWRYPETETGTFYLATFMSLVMVLPAIPQWSIENAAFQLHLLIVSGLLLFAVYRKRFRWHGL